jgi:hypothetical protein
VLIGLDKTMENNSESDEEENKEDDSKDEEEKFEGEYDADAPVSRVKGNITLHIDDSHSRFITSNRVTYSKTLKILGRFNFAHALSRCEI